jgi:membrane associated rhomboid family serine protease
MASGSRNIRYHRVNWEFFITPGVKLLLVANCAVYLLQVFIYYFRSPQTEYRFDLWFGLVPSGVIPGLRIWHILVNMFMLWSFGRELELVWGRNRFLRYYFLTGVGAGVLNVIVRTVPMLWGKPAYDIPTIGASGAIFGILIACAVLFPDRRAYLFPIPVAIKMKWIVAIMAAITFLGTFGLGDDKVSHICHLGGMVIGYLYLRRDSYLYRLRNEVSDWKFERNKKKFEVYINKHKGEPPSRPDRWVN